MREKPNIPDELIQTCLREHYNINISFAAVGLLFLPVGLDMRAGIYEAVDKDKKTSYLVKLKEVASDSNADLLYEPSCFIPRYLANRGINAVVAPLPTKQNKLWVQVENWILRVYPFIEGISSWKPEMSASEWKTLGKSLKQIHQVRLPADVGGVSVSLLRKEKFDPKEYAEWISTLEAQHIYPTSGKIVYNNSNEIALQAA